MESHSRVMDISNSFSQFGQFIEKESGSSTSKSKVSKDAIEKLLSYELSSGGSL